MLFVFFEVSGTVIGLATFIALDVAPILVRLDMHGDYVPIPENSVAKQTLEFRLHILSLRVQKDDSFRVGDVFWPLNPPSFIIVVLLSSFTKW